MIDEKQEKESEAIIRQLLRDNKIMQPDKNIKSFFLEKAINSLQVSKRLIEISINPDDSTEAYMWVINTSYYSMFFAATSLLAHFNHRIDVEVGVHKMTFHALVYYFLVDDNKLQKHFIEEYKEMQDDAGQLLQFSEEKAKEFLKSYDYEREKRTRFTYDLGLIAEKKKAETSLKRATEFLTEIRKIIE